MTTFLVSGLINRETTLHIPGFPLQYEPVLYPFFGIQSRISGVGYNLACAFTALGDEVNLLSLIGHDHAGQKALETLQRDGISAEFIIAQPAETAQSVILYDDEGRRQIHVDLKDIQNQEYSLRRYQMAARRSDVLVLCNINFSRPFLKPAVNSGKLIATDVHAISDLNDEYNGDFMRAAHVLFMSDEKLPLPPEQWIRAVMRAYRCEIAVIGMGKQGAMMAVRKDERIVRVPAVDTRPVVSSVGAGDALMAAFLHCYVRGNDPYLALEKAVVFASYKVGSVSASAGFLDDDSLTALHRECQPSLTDSARWEPAATPE